MPRIVPREEWEAERRELLEHEKALTRARDALGAERRRLPMVEVEKEYLLEGPEGRVRLPDLFGGRRQLVVYHFMFAPEWEQGCAGCSFLVDNLGHPAHLRARGTELVLVSRAPLESLERFRRRMGWTLPWYSSHGSDFNHDFHVTLDPDVAPPRYNYADAGDARGEAPGVSVFLRDGERVFHTYSAYARGTEPLLGTYALLDMTPFGRQEEWEDSPAGWPQAPTYGWLRHHDRYDAEG